ncbi:Arabinose operon regulatory protein [compost metagenome]
MTFIESEYSDSELTLNRIAQHVCLSEKYVSQLFKEHTGVNISDYVESVRINKATELLLNDRLTIDEIALQVGYNSAHTFRRAFKKVKGDSPSKYRIAAI